MEQDNRKWYQKKRFAIPLSTVAVLTAIGIFSDQPQTQLHADPPALVKTQSAPVPSTAAEVIAPVEVTNQTETVQKFESSEHKQSPTLSNNNYYENVDDNQVHSPAYSADSSIPAGASAQCGDGTYSFSQNRKGTCSHHGGVAQWY